ncbi:unnamed protein product [Mytilus coruscus]|uniref:Uncharacterized protein n=1 Tax=Mytilus coruscus TaxID=42192 RepID=A0A6J8BT83_MYTCO|nr:unnamed protein product [Mytilus coruscus]
MVFSSDIYNNYTVIVLDVDGSLNFEVKLPSTPFDIAYITEDNTLAVSSGSFSSQCITIIDMQNQKVKKTISLNGYIYGITYNGSELVYSGYYQGIRMINHNDNIISLIVGDALPAFCYVTTFGDKLYHTNPKKNNVTCFNLQGKLQWTFQNERVLQKPGGVSVDNSGNVYVVGRKSNNVIMISTDGQRHRELLSGKEGLSEPWSIHFSKERNMLIVANKRTGSAFLYSVN